MNEENPNQATGPWDLAVDQLREWDPDWADACVTMTTNPWRTEFCRASSSSWSAWV